MNIRMAAVLAAIIIISACNNDKEHGVFRRKPGSNEIAGVNSYLIEKDRERIRNFAERKNLDLKETGSGLWYLIRKEGRGNLFKDHDLVKMVYSCYLLDGTPCYSSDKSGQKELILGKSEMEAGMNEGLRMLRPGGEAVFVMPPFLAYGLLGDNKAIPPRATIVYEIKVAEK